jgi:hypothetical protein
VTWRHLALAPARWRELPERAASVPGPLAVEFAPGTTAVLAAASAARWSVPVAVWLSVSAHYPSPVAARDVATLSWLGPLSAVVLHSDDGLVDEHARVVHALLSGDDVTLDSPVANLRGAFNRPLPPRPVDVWCADGPSSLAEVVLRPHGGAAPVRSTRLDDEP